MWRWIKAHRGLFSVLIPYMAMCATFVVAIGVLAARSDAAKAAAAAAAIKAELAAEHAAEAQEETAELEREAARSCADRRQNRADVLEALRLLATVVPPRIAVAMDAKLDELKPVVC